MKRTLAGLGAVIAAVAGFSAPASAASSIDTGIVPPAHSVSISGVIFGGTGCTKNDTSLAMSDDGQTMTLIHDAFVVEAGRIVNPNGSVAFKSNNRKNCAVSLQLNYPQGFSFVVAHATFRGFADIAKGATGIQTTTYNWAGHTETAKGQSKQAGPFMNTYSYSDEVQDLAYSDCNGKSRLTYNAQVAVNAGTADRTLTSYMTLDTQEVNVSTEWNFSWKHC